jgi:hypothetical protein
MFMFHAVSINQMIPQAFSDSNNIIGSTTMPELSIDSTLYENARHVALRAGYASVEEFLIHLLEKATIEISQTDSDENVLARLRDTGYIS